MSNRVTFTIYEIFDSFSRVLICGKIFIITETFTMTKRARRSSLYRKYDFRKKLGQYVTFESAQYLKNVLSFDVQRILYTIVLNTIRGVREKSERI